MISIFRKNQQFLLVFITILIIIAFVWLYNDTQIDRLGSDKIGQIYGRTLTQTDLTRDARKFELARRLQLWELLDALVAPAATQEQALENFVLNSIVLRHEAAELGVQVLDQEVVEALKQLTIFQTNGAFDPQKYATFVERALTPFGFTEAHVEELVRDQVRLQNVRSLLGSTVTLSLGEVRSTVETGYQKTEVALINFTPAKFLPQIELTEEELKSAYEQRKEQLQTEEQRKVKFVKFPLPQTAAPDAEKPQPTPDIQQLQKQADRASEFTQTVLDQETTFEEAARKFDVPAQESDFFTKLKPDPQLEQVSGAVEAAFRLSKEDPHSDVIQSENAFYILHFEEVIPSRPLTFEEAQPQLVAQLKAERAQEQMRQKAAEVRAQIKAAMEGGQGFAEAAKAADVEVEKLPPFTLAELDSEDPVPPPVAQKSLELKEGQLSEFLPSPEGGMLIYLQKRYPVEVATFEERQASISQALLNARRELAFREWLRMRREAAEIRFFGAA